MVVLPTFPNPHPSHPNQLVSIIKNKFVFFKVSQQIEDIFQSLSLSLVLLSVLHSNTSEYFLKYLQFFSVFKPHAGYNWSEKYQKVIKVTCPSNKNPKFLTYQCISVNGNDEKPKNILKAILENKVTTSKNSFKKRRF